VKPSLSFLSFLSLHRWRSVYSFSETWKRAALVRRFARLHEVGSLLSNGGTSFPTASSKADCTAVNEDPICRNIVYFLQLMSGRLDLDGVRDAQESGSLIATLPQIVFDSSLAS
jgi:hypothetical protein